MSEILAPAIVAAVVSGFVSVTVAILNSWATSVREERARNREHFARALAAVVAYKEFPYAVRRRDASAPARERERLSTELQKVQREIAYCSAWLSVESTAVARAYGDLVARLRRVAGTAISEAWDQPGINADAQMNLGNGVDLSEINALEERYLAALQNHLVGRWRIWRRRRP